MKEAVITADKKIKCPICGKTGGILNEGAVIKNYIVRCRASRRNHQHYYRIDFSGDQEGDVRND